MFILLKDYMHSSNIVEIRLRVSNNDMEMILDLRKQKINY